MTVSDPGSKPLKPASGLAKFLILTTIGIVILGLVLLGNWQLRRLESKLALIERVESRAFTTPVAAPIATTWSGISQKSQEYRRVVIYGQFLHERETLVQALTERGGGYWVLTPLARIAHQPPTAGANNLAVVGRTPDSWLDVVSTTPASPSSPCTPPQRLLDVLATDPGERCGPGTAAGEIILINRGYVPADAANQAQRSAGLIEGEVAVTGLLRITEPGGILLRYNDPTAERWYSRDVGAIAQAQGLANVAPYFIDADATANPGGYPVGGMTRLSFRNAHLVYALTWYGLALLLTTMTLRVVWLERKR